MFDLKSSNGLGCTTKPQRFCVVQLGGKFFLSGIFPRKLKIQTKTIGVLFFDHIIFFFK
jgi:hypothetical protein